MTMSSKDGRHLTAGERAGQNPKEGSPGASHFALLWRRALDSLFWRSILQAYKSHTEKEEKDKS